MIYTASIGDRDKPRDDIKVFTEYAHFKEPVLNAKIYKVLAHLFVPGDSVWVDANIIPKVSEEAIFSEVHFDCDVALFRHPARASAMSEAKVLIEKNIGSIPDVKDWVEHHSEGLGTGLFEANVIVRRDSERVRRFNECWWSLICRWPWRDQLTLPEALRISGCRVHRFDWESEANRAHKFFRYKLHGE